ncbi:hypothetical protein [Ruegeria sp.]|uniref:hypothetical protein n=1 Tax=Ruegeria sp. TaxID=1879320 RepID=UPI003B5C178B
MTDKVVNAGIEDVLSSIKRLVSEEDRKIPSLLSTTMSRKPGRLVLTDALRVGESQPPEAQPAPTDEAHAYQAEDSVKPMLLRACDIVDHSEPAAEQMAAPEREKTPIKSLSAKIEALEAAIARTEDQWEPDGDSDDAYAGTPNATLAWAGEEEFDLVDVKGDTEIEDEAAPVATFVRGQRPSEQETPKTAPTSEPAVATRPQTTSMDEEALRTLIAQVVREELQGVLGERITRNVRKLVRREIYKALAEQKVE